MLYSGTFRNDPKPRKLTVSIGKYFLRSLFIEQKNKMRFLKHERAMEINLRVHQGNPSAGALSVWTLLLFQQLPAKWLWMVRADV